MRRSRDQYTLINERGRSRCQKDTHANIMLTLTLTAGSIDDHHCNYPPCFLRLTYLLTTAREQQGTRHRSLESLIESQHIHYRISIVLSK